MELIKVLTIVFVISSGCSTIADGLNPTFVAHFGSGLSPILQEEFSSLLPVITGGLPPIFPVITAQIPALLPVLAEALSPLLSAILAQIRPNLAQILPLLSGIVSGSVPISQVFELLNVGEILSQANISQIVSQISSHIDVSQILGQIVSQVNTFQVLSQVLSQIDLPGIVSQIVENVIDSIPEYDNLTLACYRDTRRWFGDLLQGKGYALQSECASYTVLVYKKLFHFLIREPGFVFSAGRYRKTAGSHFKRSHYLVRVSSRRK